MTVDVGQFLRSINLGLDLAAPSRFAHFEPTPKSAQVIRAVAFGEPAAASMVVAAYGSGKSLAAGFACLAVSGSPDAASVLSNVIRRLDGVDAELAGRMRNRMSAGGRGLAISLEGAQADFGDAMIAAASDALGDDIRRPGRLGIVVVLDAVAAAARAKGVDRIAIVWDEFGRHLEALAAEGRAHDLAQLQQAAEWAARQEHPAVTLTVLMHQSFFHYTGSLSHAARSAWRKVEGRFDPIRFVDDSREMHRLVASVVEVARPAGPPPEGPDFHRAAAKALAAGLFKSFGDAASLAETLAAAWPVDPAALHALPGLAARVAQHERTVFSFLTSTDLSRPVTLKDVYDGFSASMEADVGIAGMHRRWLETESALSKAESSEEALAIASTALLSLGSSGQRLKVSRETLLFAVDPWGDRGDAAATLDGLVARNLLLHRHRTDDVAVWHGTDLDLRSRLEEERARLEANFDFVSFLSTHRPPPTIRPVRYNLEYWIRRAWTGAYARVSDLISAGPDHPLLRLSPGEDGRVVYALAVGHAEAAAAAEAVPRLLPNDGGVVVCLCSEPLPLGELAVEIACLDRLAKDDALIASDPLAATEIAHMADAAMEALDRALERAIVPGKGQQVWLAAGKQLAATDMATLNEELSIIAEGRFSETPKIRNEMLVRRKLSRPLVNARKKVLLGILERSGDPHLGFEYSGGTPDAAIYRTVLHRTGLYAKFGDEWRWAASFEVSDHGLKSVWLILEDFFFTPGTKPFRTLIDRLRSPPEGLRDGLLPVLVGAGLKAFGRAVAVRRDGAWVHDILASEVEEMCSAPDRFEAEVLNVDEPDLAAYLRELADEFGMPAPEEVDLLRHAHEALEAWKAQLPDNALAVKHPTSEVRSFQLALSAGHDPVDVLLRRLPMAANTKRPGPQTIATVRRCRKVLEAVVEGYQADAIRTVKETLTVSRHANGDALERAHRWATCFSAATLPKGSVDATAKAVLSRAAAAIDGRYTEASFTRALSMLLIGQDFDRWTERTPAEFARRLKAAAEQVEEAALSGDAPHEAVRPVLEERIGDLMAKLVRMAGKKAAAELLERVARDKEVTHGDAG